MRQLLERNRELEKENAPYQELLASFKEKENDYLNQIAALEQQYETRLDEQLKYFEWQVENKDSEQVKLLQQLMEQFEAQDKGEEPDDILLVEKSFRYQLQQFDQEFESRPKSQPEWAAKTKNFEAVVDTMEADLNHTAAEFRHVNKAKLETIAKWTEKFEMSERLIASKNENEERLREMHQIELENQQADYERKMEELRGEVK